MNRPARRSSHAFCTEEDDRVAKLRADLDDFYATVRDYEAYRERNYRPDFWNPIRAEVDRVLTRSARCSVLEFGAGKTGFGEFLGELRARTEFHVQDVSRQNLADLESQADSVHIGNLLDMEGSYDVIFSTFVWEHITDPKSSLARLLHLLKPGGTLFIACPRYDFPFYLSPSIRHLSRAARIRTGMWLLSKRLGALVSGKPAFLIHCDPAVFHLPWFRDSDAVHWVSQFDIQYGIPEGWKIRNIPLAAKGLRGRFWSMFLLMFVAINKPGH